MREFPDIPSFLRFLSGVLAAVEVARERGLDAGAAIVQVESKNEIGTYQGSTEHTVAWQVLADQTKEIRRDQGFSDNEPLLREGVLRDHILRSADRDRAAVGVPDRMVQHSYEEAPVNIGQAAEDQELGTVKIPPRSFLAGAAVRTTDRAVDAIASHVVWALSGLPARNDPELRQ